MTLLPQLDNMDTVVNNTAMVKNTLSNADDWFWSRVTKLSSCWEWAGSLDSKGYGRSMCDGKRQGAHRISYQLKHGDISDKLCVCHSCDNPRCVNPEHLWLGTHKDNMGDKSLKGRTPRSFGEKNGKTKLTPETVRAIRASTNSLKDISSEFGVSVGGVCNIRNRKRWGHLS